MMKKFELRTEVYGMENILGQLVIVRNYRKEVKTVGDVYDFAFDGSWDGCPRLDPDVWYVTYAGQVLWDLNAFLERVSLLDDDVGDAMEMSLFDFVNYRVKMSESRGNLFVHKITREFIGPDLPPEDSVVLQYHGLAAYSRSGGFSEKLATCLSEAVVICGSDRAIGPVGIVFEGPVFKAHDKDIWSTRQSREVVRRIPSVTEEDFLEMSEMLIGQYQYIETFTQMREVFGIWCDPNTEEWVKEEAIQLAKEYNLEIFWGIPKRLGKPDAEKEFFAGLVKVAGE